MERFRRVTFSEITPDAVRAAFDAPRGIDYALGDAQQARRFLDRLVGYTVSPLLARRLSTALSAGRVQSVALRILVDRDRQIGSFRPAEFYGLDVSLPVEGVRHFPAILDVGFTAELEKSLDLVARREMPYRRLLDEFYGALSADLDGARGDPAFALPAPCSSPRRARSALSAPCCASTLVDCSCSAPVAGPRRSSPGLLRRRVASRGGPSPARRRRPSRLRPTSPSTTRTPAVIGA